jgi:hypothetical protein
MDKLQKSIKEVIEFKHLPTENEIHVVIQESFEDIQVKGSPHQVKGSELLGSLSNTKVYTHVRVYKYIYGVRSGRMTLLHVIPGSFIPAAYQNARYEFSDDSMVELDDY